MGMAPPSMADAGGAAPAMQQQPLGIDPQGLAMIAHQGQMGAYDAQFSTFLDAFRSEVQQNREREALVQKFVPVRRDEASPTVPDQLPSYEYEEEWAGGDEDDFDEWPDQPLVRAA